MIWLVVHLSIGLVLVVQSVVRRRSPRMKSMDDWLLCVGAVVIWPIVLGSELHQLWKERQR